jgi:hypothetical protein
MRGMMTRAALVAWASGGAGAAQPEWVDLFHGTGPDGEVHALCVHDDGTGPALYAAGEFFAAGGVPTSNVARFRGGAWEPVGDGIDTGFTVELLGLQAADVGDGPHLYVTGNFFGGDMQSFAVWDGVTWDEVPGSPNAWYRGVTASDIGGRMCLYISGGISDYVRRWDGAAWDTPGGGLEGVILDFAEFDDGAGLDLYAGGGLDALYRFDGAAWEAINGHFSMGGSIFSLEVHDAGDGESLVMGGQFRRVPVFTTANNIARWDGNNWHALGEGTDGPVQAMLSHAGVLMVGGEFGVAGAASASSIAIADGDTWSPVGEGVDGRVNAMTRFDPDGAGPMAELVIVGGAFSSAGGVSASNIGALRIEACRADLNADGVVDSRDFVRFLNHFGAGDPDADFNADGSVDSRDFVAFLNAFVEGC